MSLRYAVKYEGRTVRRFLTHIEAQAFIEREFPAEVSEVLENRQVLVDESR
jgi:hypothetical protein